MNDPEPVKPAQDETPRPPQQQITEQQIKEGAQAALEVLNGAPPGKILELMGHLIVAKLLLGAIARGELIVAQPRQAIPGGKPKGANSRS